MEELPEKSAQDFNNDIIKKLRELHSQLITLWDLTANRDFGIKGNTYFRKLIEICNAASNEKKKIEETVLANTLDEINAFIQKYRIKSVVTSPIIDDINAKKARSAELIAQLKNSIFPPAHAPAVVADLAAGAAPAPAPGVAPAADPNAAGAASDAAPAAGVVPAPPPQPEVVVDNQATDNMTKTKVYKSIESYVTTFNQGRAEKAKLENQPAIANHDIHCKVNFPVASNISPITFKRPTNGHLSLSTDNPTPETLAQQAKILTNLPDAGPKTLKLRTVNPSDFKALWKALREEGHHITDLSHEQQAILEADHTLDHLRESAGPSYT